VGNQLAHREKATHTKNASTLVPHFPGRWHNNRNRTKATGKGQTNQFPTGQISPSDDPRLPKNSTAPIRRVHDKL
jgi:hypothetical protein